MDYSIWASFAESRMAIVIVTGLKFAIIVAFATIICSAVAIFAIEGLEGAARSVRAWLKKPRNLNGAGLA
jgi:hypothetical protein